MLKRILYMMVLCVLAAVVQVGDADAVGRMRFPAPVSEHFLSTQDFDVEPASAEFGIARSNSGSGLSRVHLNWRKYVTVGFSSTLAYTKSGRPMTFSEREVALISSDLLTWGDATGSEYLLGLSRLVI